MPLDATSLPALAPAPTLEPRRRKAPFWRGAAGAVSLAVWSVVGVARAALALVPVLFEDGPRGRVRPNARIRSIEPATSRLAAVAEIPGEPARAAGEAYPR